MGQHAAGPHAGQGAEQGGFRRLLAVALAVRLLLLPLAHTWDTQTWANTFAELALQANLLDAARQPYETERALSLLTQAGARQGAYYEYWAYPPLMLYAWWPLAHLYTALGGTLQADFPAQPAFIAPAIPLGLLALIRLPVIAADLASLALLRALGVPLRAVRWYAFNPLVLLVGVWTFDAVMVAFTLLALLLAERGRWAAAGAALALGAATKFIPLVALPALLLAALHASREIVRPVASPGRPHPNPLPEGEGVGVPAAACRWQHVALGSGERPDVRQPVAGAAWRQAGLAAGAFGLTLGLLVLPVWEGLLYVLRFHAERFGAGLSWGQALAAWAQLDPAAAFEWQPLWQGYAAAQVGTLALPLALLVGVGLLVWRPVPLATGFLVLVLAFLVGSKLVNEPYALLAVALATVEAARRPAFRPWRALLWAVPFAYAVINTPIWTFFFSALRQVAPAAGAEIALWAAAYRQVRGLPESGLPYAFLGVAFALVAGAAAVAVWRGAAPRQPSGAGRAAGAGAAA